jgi:hypothetical protein
MGNDAEMSETKTPYGKPVKLLVDLQGFPDGRMLIYQIWRKKAGTEEKITEVFGVTKNGKGIGYWMPQPPQIEERQELLSLEKEISQQPEAVKFYFIAKIDEEEVKSEDMVFTYSLDVYLECTNGKPIEGAKYKITFADGNSFQGVFRSGHAKFDDAPPGKFKVELEDYEFVFESIS